MNHWLETHRVLERMCTFAVLVSTLLLLTFMGDALRDALDPRKAQVSEKA